MKHRRVTRTIVEDFYSCERCGYGLILQEPSKFTVLCPEHGEFCPNCCNKEESRYPLIICPECNITWKEVMRGVHRTGPNFQFDKIEVPEPFIVIRDDSSGTWIGSKK